MMLKIRKSKVRVVGVITFLSLLSISYVGLSFYSVPEKVSATDSNGAEEWRTLSDITYMQEMTIDICNNSEIGDNKPLEDKRDGNKCTVKKLSDNNCWMDQNLRITGDSIISWLVDHPDKYNSRTLTQEYTDNPQERFLLPKHSLGYWDVDESTSVRVYYQYATSGPNSALDTNDYGGYYSWCTATAGTCANNGNATGSICPKGWRLPLLNSGDTNYRNLITNENYFRIGENWGSSEAINGNGYWIGGRKANAVGASFFPAAGQIYNNTEPNAIGRAGYYWSSQVNNAYTQTYIFALGSTNPNADNHVVPHGAGLPVRCVANPAIHSDPVPPTDERHTDVAVHVGPTITIDTTTNLYGEVDYTKVLEDSITATVSSNNAYQLLLSAEQTSLLDATQPDNTGIPTLTATKALEKNTNAWGIYSGNLGENTSTEANPRTYAPITTSPSKHYYYNLPPDENMAVTSVFGIGITVSAGLPNGTYSTNVTVTAVNG